MKTLKLLAWVVGSCLSFSAFAAEPVAKEDTTPLSSEGALTASEIPPISNIGKPVSTPTQSPTPAPAAKPTLPATNQSPVSWNDENNIPTDDGQNIQFE